MPTKILLYDLDATLQNVFQDLKNVQGDFNSLKERFSNIDINMFDSDIKSILQDLLDALNKDQKGTAAERLRNIEQNLQELSAQLSHVSLNSLEMGNFNETFEYDEDGNVIKHISTGDQEFVVDYVYKSDGSGDIESSKKTFTLEDGSTVVIQKQYTYTNGDITGIQTTTTITPPSTETPTDTPTDTPSTTK